MITRREFTLFAAGIGAASAFPALAATLTRDKDYTLVDPPQPPLEAPKGGRRIEVIEFFYYGCPHCYSLQPALLGWLKNVPKDVDFRRMPTVFRESWVPLTRTYYALEVIGALEKVHEDVFNMVHQNSVNLGDRRILLEWAAKKGVDAKKLGEAFDSFTVQTKTQRSIQLTRAYGISGTPSIVVDGRYLTGPSMTVKADNSVDYARFTQVLNDLIDLARKTPAGSKG